MSKFGVLALTLISLMAIGVAFANPVWSATENSWTEKAAMHQARGGLGVAVVDNKIYAIGGSTQIGYQNDQRKEDFVGTNEQYDPATDTWTTKAPMPTARTTFSIAASEGKIYCIGGRIDASGTATAINEVYDPTTDTWENKTPMPTARVGMQANVVGNKIYLIGGATTTGYFSLNEVYDPATDSWTTKTPIPPNAGLSVSAVVDAKIYVMGYSASAYDLMTQVYDPETDQWSVGAVPPSWFGFGTAAATTGVFAPKRIYIVSDQGTDIYTSSDSNQVYDPASNRWSNGMSIPVSRKYSALAVVNDILYVIGGHTYNIINYIVPSAEIWQYTPIGYVAPNPTHQTPTPSTSSPTPTLNPTLSSSQPSPTQPPTSSPTGSQPPTSSPLNSQQPAVSPENKTAGLQMGLLYAAAIAITIIVAFAAAAILFRRRK